MHFAWMAWTLPTAIFFCLLAGALAVMTWLAVRYPEAERVGVLRIPTTRGDRLFISLIAAAVGYYQAQTFLDLQAALERRAKKPRDKLLAVFDIRAEAMEAGDFTGCFAINAKLEYEGKEQ